MHHVPQMNASCLTYGEVLYDFLDSRSETNLLKGKRHVDHTCTEETSNTAWASSKYGERLVGSPHLGSTADSVSQGGDGPTKVVVISQHRHRLHF